MPLRSPCRASGGGLRPGPVWTLAACLVLAGCDAANGGRLSIGTASSVSVTDTPRVTETLPATDTLPATGTPPTTGLASVADTMPATDPDSTTLPANHDEETAGAPIDRGDPGASLQSATAARGDPVYRRLGSWSPPLPWPQIPIHAALTPDGRVMTFGTDGDGGQGAEFGYTVWDPVNGDHLVLPNTTSTDIFCSAQILLPGSGDLLLAGGDIRARGQSNGEGGIRDNWGVDDVNRYRPSDGTLVSDAPMRFARWYPSLLTLADGRIFASGGVDENGRPVSHPEIYDPVLTSWRTLEGIRYRDHYPRTFVAPSGRIVAVIGRGVHWIDVEGRGAVRRAATLRSATHWKMPAVEYDIGKLMVVRGNGGTSLIDISGAAPRVTEGPGAGPRREWASLTVLADGQVLMTGGGVDNTGGDRVSLDAALWQPESNAWVPAAAAAKPREYHSLALLLPDGRVLAAGGGAPGPTLHLNGEIFTPPYLYDEHGELASRPALASAPTTLAPGPLGYAFRMASTEPVSRVTLVRTGSVTHAFNFDQGFLTLSHTQQGDRISVDVDQPSSVLRPGFYLMFAFDDRGVPSLGHIVRVDPRPDPAIAGEARDPRLSLAPDNEPATVTVQSAGTG